MVVPENALADNKDWVVVAVVVTENVLAGKEEGETDNVLAGKEEEEALLIENALDGKEEEVVVVIGNALAGKEEGVGVVTDDALVGIESEGEVSETETWKVVVVVEVGDAHFP